MLCIVGGGKMGSAIAGGLVASGLTEPITVVEKEPAARESLKAKYPSLTVTDTQAPCDAALIAVKPKDVDVAVTDAVSAGAKRIVSIAAGITAAQLHDAAGGRIPVVRAMPNIGAVAGTAASAICGGVTAHEEDLVWAEQLLASIGTVVRVTEEQMDAVTGLSGSGPAYIFLVVEALIDAGVHAGLPVDVSEKLAIGTVKGAANLLGDELSPTELRAMVTTPSGTTAAGLRVLEERGVRSAFIEAVGAATRRSHELGLPQSH